MILRSLLVAVYCSLFAQTIRASCGPNRSSQTIVYGEPRPDGGSVSVTMDVTSDTIPIKVYGNNPFASSIITLGGNRDQNMNTYSGKDYGREYKSYGNYASGSRVTMEKTKPKMPRVSSINERPIPYRSIDSSDRSPSAIVKSVKSKWIELPPQTRSYYSSSRPPSSQMMPMTSESQNIEMPNIDKILYEQNVLRNENDKISIDSLSNEFNIKQDYNNSNLDTNQIQMEIPFEIPKSSNLKSNGKLQTFITKDGLFGVLIPVEDLNIMKPVIESTKKKMTR